MNIYMTKFAAHSNSALVDTLVCDKLTYKCTHRKQEYQQVHSSQTVLLLILLFAMSALVSELSDRE